MSSFWILALGLAALAAGALLWPAWRRAGGRLWGVAGAVLAIGLATGLYLRLSNWTRQSPDPQLQQAMDQLTELRRDTDRHPEDLTAWLKLGNDYLRLEQYEAARRSFERASRLGGARSAPALAGLAEAQLLGAATASSAADNAAADARTMASAARAGELFEQALKIDPANGKALFYSAMLALQRGELPLARARLASMRAGDVPADVAAALDKQIAAIDAQLKPAAIDAATAIRLDIRVADALRAQLPAQASLFVFVRGAAGGAPLAVKRLSTALPAQVVLSSADSMIAGNGVKPGQKVSVVARVSLSGAPTAQSGDPYGELQTTAGAPGTHSLLIDKRTP